MRGEPYDVRCGSTTALAALKRDFRSVPESSHSLCSLACLKRANTGSQGTLRLRHAVDQQLSDKRKLDPERRAAVAGFV